MRLAEGHVMQDKTEASSIYRKLGASTRSQAIARCRELGLLDG